MFHTSGLSLSLASEKRDRLLMTTLSSDHVRFLCDSKKNPLQRLTVKQVKPRVSDKNIQDSRQNPQRNQLPQIHRDIQYLLDAPVHRYLDIDHTNIPTTIGTTMNEIKFIELPLKL
jgi:hypothetical protein